MKRFTHSGLHIPALQTGWEIVREIMQEVVESAVFSALAVSFWLVEEGSGDGLSTVISWAATGMALMLGCFAFNRLFVVCQLMFRFRDLER